MGGCVVGFGQSAEEEKVALETYLYKRANSAMTSPHICKRQETT